MNRICWRVVAWQSEEMIQPQTIHSRLTERSVGLCPPMMQALQQSAG